MAEIIIQGASKFYLEDLPHLLYIAEPFSMVYGLLIYLYARNLSKPHLFLKKSDWLFVIPFGLSILSYLPYYLSSGKEKLLDYYNYGSLDTDIQINIWEWNFDIVLSVAFLLAALSELKKYKLTIQNQVADVRQVDLHLTQLIIVMGIISYIAEFIAVYLTFYGFPHYSVLFGITSATQFFILIFIGYDAIVSYKHVDALHRNWAETKSSVTPLRDKPIKYSKSSLTEEGFSKIKNELLNYMTEHKPYLNSKIRIKDLSELTSIPAHHISQVINESLDQNFYEFINHYRIERAKELLQDKKYENYTYSAIGFEVGFNSKSAFYTAFKKNTGTTPSNFKG